MGQTQLKLKLELYFTKWDILQWIDEQIITGYFDFNQPLSTTEQNEPRQTYLITSLLDY